MKVVQNRVCIRFLDYEKSTIHRIRNFGEELWTSFRYNQRVDIDIGEIDRATDEIVFFVRDKFLRRSLAKVRRLLEAHFMTDEVVVEIEDMRKST